MTTFEPFIGGIDFGEGPRWHDGRLWYSDFFQHRVSAVDMAGNRETMIEFPGQPSGLGWMPDGSLLIVSMLDRKVMRWADGALTEHADLNDIATFHCNDMIVDGAGNAYVGNFGWDIFTDGSEITPADLALVRPDGSVEVAATGLLFPNGMVITPDAKTLIVGETFGARYRAFDIADDATLGNERVWAGVPGTAPDGCDLDAEGAIWFADARGGNVVRVTEGGEVTHTVPTDTRVFACALGGDDGRTLFAVCAPGSSPAEVGGKASGSIKRMTVDVPSAAHG
jgi:sugar lactone lactonase YvrE